MPIQTARAGQSDFMPHSQDFFLPAGPSKAKKREAHTSPFAPRVDENSESTLKRHLPIKTPKLLWACPVAPSKLPAQMEGIRKAGIRSDLFDRCIR